MTDTSSEQTEPTIKRGRRQRKRHVVATREELPVGGRTIAKIGRREIGVFNVDGKLYAITNVCPHHLGPLCLGAQTSEMTGGADRKYELKRDGMILRCPWHQFEFDIETGRNLADGNQWRAAVYPAEWEDDEAVVYI